MRVQRRNGLRLRFYGTRLLVDGPELSAGLAVDAAAARILTFAVEPVEIDALVEWSELEPRDAHRLIDELILRGMLVHGQSAGTPPPWDAWGEAAWFAHWEGERTRFAADHVEVDTLKNSLSQRPQPHRTTERHRGRPFVRLPASEEKPLDASLKAVLRNRRSTQLQPSTNPTTVGDVATVLGETFRSRSLTDAKFFGVSHLKAYPSAGARHDIDAYVLVFDVPGIPSASYWYDDEQHTLRQIGTAPSRDLWDAASGQQHAPDYADFAVLTVSATERLAWKYRSPHAYRHVWQHTGHAVQVMLMVATALGLAQRLTGALSADDIRSQLGLTSDEIPTFLTCFNRRPGRG